MEKAIKMTISHWGADDTIIVPLWENYDNETAMSGDAETDQDAFNELVEYWKDNLDYGISVDDCELVEHEQEKDVVICDEFGIYLYKSEALFSDNMYARPFDENHENLVFACYIAMDAYKGNVYSKDFSYYNCDACGRDVCGQNPSNGYHSQVHIFDGYVVCNKCYEESALENGIDEEFDGETIPGQFFNDNDIEAAGWTLEHDCLTVGHGQFGGYGEPSRVIDILRDYKDKGIKFLVNYENMAIGGLGVTVSIYTKK